MTRRKSRRKKNSHLYSKGNWFQTIERNLRCRGRWFQTIERNSRCKGRWFQMIEKNSCCKGSMTVEAVFLIPIIIFVIFALMYMTLYFYDQVLIDTTSRRAALEQEQKIRHTTDEKTGMIQFEKVSVKGLENLLQNYDTEEEIITNKLKKINKNMFQGAVKNTKVSIRTGDIEISEDSEILSLTKAVGSYLPKSSRSNRHYVKLAVHNPEEFVRGYTALEEIAEQTGQGGKIKQTLKKLLKYMGR